MNDYNKFDQTQNSTERAEILLPPDQREFMVSHTKTAFEVAKVITRRTAKLFLYGGTVRNLLIGASTSMPDYDFIGDFNPDQIQSDFPELVIKRNDRISNIRMKIGSAIYDFTWAKDVRERLAIGDITASNLCMTEDGIILDFFGGVDSLQRKEITITDPETKILMDPRRILRVFRFAFELGFNIEQQTLEAAVNYAYLLPGARGINEELWQILSLEEPLRNMILESLHNHGIDHYLTYPDAIFEAVRTSAIENKIRNYPSVNTVANMFEAEVYLVGGALRDTIWDKKVNDLDFKVYLPIEEVIQILESHSFCRSSNHSVKDYEYFVSTFAGVVGTKIDGMKVHLSTISSVDFPTLIDQGDLNLSCCIYNIHSGKIENPEMVTKIAAKQLDFCNIDNARNDPMIIINALKQISRHPDMIISEEVYKIIRDCIPGIAEHFRANPNFAYKLESLCGNLNSEEVYAIFGSENLDLFDGLGKKRDKLKVSNPEYESVTLEDLDPEDKVEIAKLLKAAYGKHFDASKSFASNINSVVYEKRDGRIVACCLVDGERLYAVAARDGYDWIAIVADIVRSNYNVWCTVDCANPKIQALCSVAGLSFETNPSVIKKILTNKSDKYSDIILYEENGVPVFKKNNVADDYPQVMLRS